MSLQKYNIIDKIQHEIKFFLKKKMQSGNGEREREWEWEREWGMGIKGNSLMMKRRINIDTSLHC